MIATEAAAADTDDMRDIAVRLGADGLSKRYGTVQANRDISISVAPREIHAIVGENGAGKSTLMRMLQGIERPDSGHVVVDDRPVTLSSPQQAFALGVGMVHQEFMLAPDLTLLENLVLGDEPAGSGPLGRIEWADALRSGAELAGQTAVDVDWNRRAGSTPVHVRQFVEIIRLLRRGATILILDEPTAVLAPQQVEDLFQLLRTLRDQGTTIIFISHKLREVMSLADRVTVMRRGEVCFSSRIEATSADEIAGHMIGQDRAPERTGGDASASMEPGDVVLDVRHLSSPALEKSHPLHDIDLSVRQGEIVGIAGVSGNGQHELIECLVGLRPVAGGSVWINGEDATSSGNDRRRALGMGYVSADRRQEGLALDASIEANVVAGSHRAPPVCRGRFLDLRAMRRTAVERLQSLDVRYGMPGDAVSSLSGGNQQKLVFAREIARKPSLLVVSQPTRGVDLVGIAAIHGIMRGFCNGGGAVLLVSEELDELVDLSDRIVVMAGGRIVGERVAGDADMADIGRMMLMQGGVDG
ncbi:MAG: ABC transporter ATP-binding protein [Rhizobiaceae bacterium]